MIVDNEYNFYESLACAAYFQYRKYSYLRDQASFDEAYHNLAIRWNISDAIGFASIPELPEEHSDV